MADSEVEDPGDAMDGVARSDGIGGVDGFPGGFPYGGFDGYPGIPNMTNYNFSRGHPYLGHHNAYGDAYMEEDFMGLGFVARTMQRIHDHEWILWAAIAVFVVTSIVRFRKDDMQIWWRRRKAAARYKRSKKGDTYEADSLELADEPSSDSGDEPSCRPTGFVSKSKT